MLPYHNESIILVMPGILALQCFTLLFPIKWLEKKRRIIIVGKFLTRNGLIVPKVSLINNHKTSRFL